MTDLWSFLFMASMFLLIGSDLLYEARRYKASEAVLLLCFGVGAASIVALLFT